MVPGQIFPEKNGPLGPKFHGKLVHSRTKIFRGGPIFHEKIGPPDQNSMKNWSPGPKFSRTNFPVTVPMHYNIYIPRAKSPALSVYRQTFFYMNNANLSHDKSGAQR